MLNGLLQDIGNGLANKPFERVSWWLGPRWVAFISVEPSLTKHTPLWGRDESCLKSVRLFGLRPDKLETEIVLYWQQPFWKRWLLGLFTPIHNKIKLWSYYQRCLSFREVCIKNLFGEKEPIALVFEQYLGREILHRLNRNRIQYENYLEKRAGNLRWIQNNELFISKFFCTNWQIFSKLMKKKLTPLHTETELDKNGLPSQLEKEFHRLNRILFQYLSIWSENIFNSTNDETINNNTFVDASTEKEISYSIYSIENLVKMKRQMIKSMLEETSPEQFLNIKNLLESCLAKLRSLIDTHLNNSVKLIVEVRNRRLNGDEAIQQVEILHTGFIRLFRKSVLLFHPDKSFENEELRKINTELFQQFQQLSEESLEIIKGDLLTLQDYLPKQRDFQEFWKTEQEDVCINQQAQAIEERKIETDAAISKFEADLETQSQQTQAEIETKTEEFINSSVFSKLIKSSEESLIWKKNKAERMSFYGLYQYLSEGNSSYKNSYDIDGLCRCFGRY